MFKNVLKFLIIALGDFIQLVAIFDNLTKIIKILLVSFLFLEHLVKIW